MISLVALVLACAIPSAPSRLDVRPLWNIGFTGSMPGVGGMDSVTLSDGRHCLAVASNDGIYGRWTTGGNIVQIFCSQEGDSALVPLPRYWWAGGQSGASALRSLAPQDGKLRLLLGRSDGRLVLLSGDSLASRLLPVLADTVDGVDRIELADIDHDGVEEILCLGGDAFLKRGQILVLDQEFREKTRLSLPGAEGAALGHPLHRDSIDLVVPDGTIRRWRGASLDSVGRRPGGLPWGLEIHLGDLDQDGLDEIVADSGIVVGFRAATGERLWSYLPEGNFDAVVVAPESLGGPDRVFVGDDQWGEVYCLEQDGSVAWQVHNPNWGVWGLWVGRIGDGRSAKVVWAGGVGTTGDDLLVMADVLRRRVVWRSPDHRLPVLPSSSLLDEQGRRGVLVAIEDSVLSMDSSGARRGARLLPGSYVRKEVRPGSDARTALLLSDTSQFVTADLRRAPESYAVWSTLLDGGASRSAPHLTNNGQLQLRNELDSVIWKRTSPSVYRQLTTGTITRLRHLDSIDLVIGSPPTQWESGGVWVFDTSAAKAVRLPSQARASGAFALRKDPTTGISDVVVADLDTTLFAWSRRTGARVWTRRYAVDAPIEQLVLLPGSDSTAPLYAYATSKGRLGILTLDSPDPLWQSPVLGSAITEFSLSVLPSAGPAEGWILQASATHASFGYAVAIQEPVRIRGGAQGSESVRLVLRGRVACVRSVAGGPAVLEEFDLGGRRLWSREIALEAHETRIPLPRREGSTVVRIRCAAGSSAVFAPGL